MPAKEVGQMYVANQSFATVVDGEQLWVSKGDRAEKGASILKRHEEFFDVEDETNIRFKKRPTVEQATAAPGEKRGEE
jgi:hypothetical protein